MSSRQIQNLMIFFYIGLFFLYLFAPLFMMGAAAFAMSAFTVKL